jgi:predicted nucleotidyltransferase component of viral defense system
LEELELLGFTATLDKERETESMHRIRLKIDRPDTGSITPISIEVLKVSVPEEKTTKGEIHSPYPGVPKIDFKTLTQDALLLEKISAVCDRNRPRDVHDVYRLLKNGASMEIEELKEHCEGFTVEKFERSLDEKKSGWRGLKDLLVGTLPEFEEEKQYIVAKIRQKLRT